MINLPDALDDPNLFLPFFQGPSWDGWRVIGRAANALPMTPQQLITFGQLAGGRDPPKRRVRELWVAAGRRAGKDFFASAMATVAALQTYEGLRPGEPPTILCLACDKPQARIILRYIRAYFEQIELLKGLVARETADGFELTNGAEILVITNSYRSVRGRSYACVVFDECAFWRDESSANPDVETYNAVVPGMATIPDAMLVVHERSREAVGQYEARLAVREFRASNDIGARQNRPPKRPRPAR